MSMLYTKMQFMRELKKIKIFSKLITPLKKNILGSMMLQNLIDPFMHKIQRKKNTVAMTSTNLPAYWKSI